MARVSANKNLFQFNKGLITEATGLSFPENSMLSAVNIDLNFDGSISRRKGLEMEEGGSFSMPLNGDIVQTYVWENAGKQQDQNILVVRSGNFLRFYNLTSDTVSTSQIGSAITLADEDGVTKASFASGNGYLFLAWGSLPATIEYTGSDFEITYIRPYIRDLEGIDDFNGSSSKRFKETDFTSIYTKALYIYNLLNQGWPAKKIPTVYGTMHAWDAFKTAVGAYPSHSDTYVADGLSYDPRPEKLLDPSTNEPSRGRFLMNIFSLTRHTALDDLTDAGTYVTNDVRVSVASNYPGKNITSRPTAVGFYQGHAVFGGITDKEHASKIFFSQSVKSVDDIHKCYSINDPTKDIESSPLATDGGVITINGMGKLIKIVEYGPWCVILAENGVWSISGSGEDSFSVSSAVVTKLSEAGAVGIDNIINVDSAILYWSDQGIYAISPDNTSMKLIVQNITQTTIDSLYKDLPTTSRIYSTSVYDKYNSKVYWLYNSEEGVSPEIRCMYDKALVLDTRLQAFYEYVFPAGPIRVAGAVYKKDLRAYDSTIDVLYGTIDVIAITEDVVISGEETSSKGTPSLLFLGCRDPLLYAPYMSFGLMRDRTFKDWAAEGGNYFDSYIETGYETLEAPANVKSIGSLHCFFNRTETSYVDRGGNIEFDYPSSCIMTTKWEWTGTGAANRWSQPQQVYRFRVPYVSGGDGTPFDYDYAVISTRNKVLGKGKAAVLRFESEDAKDFQLLGWSVEYTAGSKA